MTTSSSLDILDKTSVVGPGIVSDNLNAFKFSVWQK